MTSTTSFMISKEIINDISDTSSDQMTNNPENKYKEIPNSLLLFQMNIRA